MLDIRQWLANHGIGVRAGKPWQGGTLYQLDECPFSGDHKDGAFAIQFPSGGIHAGCHHSTCGSGKQRWQELREKYEPSAGKHTQQAQKTAVPPRLPPGPSPVPSSAELSYRTEALEVLQHGDPKKVMLETFLLDHVGDEIVAECLIMSFTSRSVENTKGLHVSVTGETGKGKSVTFDTFLLQVPKRFKLVGAMSNKALYYIENLMPGTAIVFDDKTLSDDMQEILKSATSTFRKPIDYRTVNKDRKPIVCTIPERCVWWMAKVEGAGDDQVFNRMLTCWIDESCEQDDRVLTRVLGEIIGKKRFHVVIPFARRIRFQTKNNRRNPEMLLDLVKANAVLMAQQRERQVVDGVTCITATRGDFDAAVRLYGLLNGTDGGQGTKLTRKESNLITVIEQSTWVEFTIPMLQKVTGYTNGGIYRIVHGYTSREVTYTGLLEKCPAIAYCDRTVSVDDDMTGVSMRRRTNAYTFDRDLYQKWRIGGSVWIEEDNPYYNEPGDGKQGNDENKPSALRQGVNIPPALQQSSINTPATAGGFKNDATDADCGNKDNYTHLGTSDLISSSRSAVMQQPAIATAPAPLYICDPGIAGGHDLKTEKLPQICEQTPEQTSIALQHVLEDCSKQGGFAGGQPTSLTVDIPPARLKIHATEYKPLDIPEPHVHCHCCGKKGSWYVEKLTAERRARPKDKQSARRVCWKCYDAAVRRDRASAPPLPGMIDLVGMERHYPNIGKCSVCDL